jgi:hypothetical protein
MSLLYAPAPTPSMATPPPRTMSAFRFPFERLPAELRLKILTSLDYPTLLALAQANRFLHQAVNPQAVASLASKFSFVMEAENHFSKHFPGVVQGQEHPGNYACYACFRVRGPAHFDAEQPHTIYVDEKGQRIREPPKPQVSAASDGAGPEGIRLSARAVTLRRFCIECGVREGLHLPGDLLVTKLRQELWVCKCRVVWEKPTCLKCTRCGGDCPLRPRGKA